MKEQIGLTPHENGRVLCITGNNVRIPAGYVTMDVSRPDINTKAWSGTFFMKAAGRGGAAKIGKIQFGTASTSAGLELW